MNLPTALITGLAALGIGTAVLAFLRTPRPQRFGLPQPRRKPGVEYAELYSLKERLRLFALAAGGLGVLYLVGKLWLLPSLRGFLDHPPCYTLAGIDGTTLLFHGLFTGLPLAMALLAATLIAPRGLRILRDGQVPTRGEKTFHLTPIRRGGLARLIGWAHLLAPLVPLLLAAWGAWQTERMLAEVDLTRFDYSRCPAASPNEW